jgi:glutamine---fructose-6-phosphate transaminase (isomerizing)
MSFFLQDILRQPQELEQTLEFLNSSGRHSMARAIAAVQKARHIYFTGMGGSWHAALSAAFICHCHRLPAHSLDACDLLEFSVLPPESVVVIISRSGRSIELEPLIQVAHGSGAMVVGITTNQESPLASQSDIPIIVPTKPDYAISVNTFSTLALTAAVLASEVTGSFNRATRTALAAVLKETSGLLPTWQEAVADTSWLMPRSPYYFLARRSSLASAQAARLVWEEGVKAPATAMGIGSFRHGPQEIITPEVRFGLWMDANYMKAQDLAVAYDLKRLGAQVMLIGQNLPADAATLMFQIPQVPREWQFLIDVIPAQLAAERLAMLSGVDCDVFRYCSFVVEDDHGLLKAGSMLQ